MPRAIRNAKLETRTARLKLPVAKKPIYLVIAKGIALGYRRNQGAGAWVVRGSNGAGSHWTKGFGQADDFEDADGSHVLDFWQATEKAKQLARGTDADTGRPVTVSEALTDYAADLAARGADSRNATRVREHLTPSLLSKPVSLLVPRELTKFRNDLLAGGMLGSSVNRSCKALKAALNHAVKLDDRITNSKAWQTGLAAVAEIGGREANVVLTAVQVRAVVAAAYDVGPGFGLLVETHAVTGQRTSQIAELTVADLQPGAAPKLLMPSSLKGKGRTQRTRRPVPIPPGLAKRLQAAAAGRAANEPLLLGANGRRWSAGAHYWPFAEAAKAAGLATGTTIYALRHSAITHALLAGTPIRLVASSFDTSTHMIEKTYSKSITDHGDEQMRRGMFDADAADAAAAPNTGNVFSITPRHG